MQDKGQVYSVIDLQSSPHQFTLSPADRIALDTAQLLLWIGPEFEIFLADFFTREDSANRVITALELSEMNLRQFSSGQADPHLWLDTNNGLLIAEEITRRLKQIDPANGQDYEENLRQFAIALEASESKIARLFSNPVASRYAVYHDGYQYFEQQFGLQHAVVLVDDPEVQPGMKQLLQVRDSIQRVSPQCLMLEQDSNQALVDTIMVDTDYAAVVIDLLGYNVMSGPEGYLKLIERVAEDFAGCLYQASTPVPR